MCYINHDKMNKSTKNISLWSWNKIKIKSKQINKLLKNR